MRAVFAALLITLAACATAAPEPVHGTRAIADRWAQPREAMLTDGHGVTVQSNAQGDLIIVEPYDLRGREVAIVNDSPSENRPIVALLDAEQVARLHRARAQGSAGDVQQR
jgi:hypothetical protein